MLETALSCPQCRAPWPADPATLAGLEYCPQCDRRVRVEIFPAFTRPVATGSAGESIVVEGEAACFYHPQKRAAVPCGACGRFLCGLCDLELNGQHLCPACLEAGRQKGRLKGLDTRRTLYDSAALTLALVGPLLCFWGAFLTAPAAIIMALYGWNKPSSLIPRTRIRSVLALILAGLELIGLAILIYAISHPKLFD
jgi:hypothetical protein